MNIGKDYIGIGVGAVILNDKEEILLLLRNKNPESGMWSIPGGKVEFFENIEDAIIREVKEELGIDIHITKLLGITNHILKGEKTHWVAPTFLVSIKSGQIQNLEPNKHKEVKWFSMKNLPENITLTTYKALEFMEI